MASNMIEIGFSDEAKELLRALARHADDKVQVEPWEIDSPQGRLACYVNDDNQEHWMPLGSAVPEGFRKLFIAVRK